MGEAMTADDTARGLIARAQEGDRAAFDRLVEVYRDRLAARIETRVGASLRQAVEVEDILQETLLRAFRSLGRFEWRGEESFHRWLCGIAEHAILKAAHRHRRGPGEPLRADLAGKGTSPSTLLRRNERFDRLQDSMDSLSDDHREVIRLARIERLPMEEIARRLGRSPEATKQLLRRALVKLREKFGETESIHLPDRRLEGGAPGGEPAADPGGQPGGQPGGDPGGAP